MKSVITFAILGDSAATGVGDYDAFGRTRGWCFHLAQAFHETLNIVPVARAGAQSREVREVQLPKVLAFKPDLAALVVGGNDALRNGFSPQALYENLKATIVELKSHRTEILMLQLHDPTKIVPMPRLLARVLTRRIEAVNAVYERLASEFEVILLRTRTLPEIYDRKLWHFDRMHPSGFGHRTLARNFRDLLQLSGWKLGDVPLSIPDGFTRRESAIWFAKNGIPWFFKRSFDLLPAAIFLMFIEAMRITALKTKNLLFREVAQTTMR